jgi:hypothetical protein
MGKDLATVAVGGFSSLMKGETSVGEMNRVSKWCRLEGSQILQKNERSARAPASACIKLIIREQPNKQMGATQHYLPFMEIK